MRELTTQTGIVVKCSKTAIEFFQNAQSVDFFSVLEIPEEFQGIAVEYYDLIMENDHLAALLVSLTLTSERMIFFTASSCRII